MTPRERALQLSDAYEPGRGRAGRLIEIATALIAEAEREARAAAIEECAQIADETIDALSGISCRDDHQEGGLAHAEHIAKTIRALAAKPEPPQC